MTTDARGGVVVVANPNEITELTDMLQSAGNEISWSGDGSDDTLQRIKRDPPGVVVLCAHLDQGDSRSLAAAVRIHASGTGIVLIGETDGPVRNALDAVDFDVDRFVGRPLAAKALRFAVKSVSNMAQHLFPDRAGDASAALGADRGAGSTRGDISSSDEDIASLMARLYTSGFTGRVVFRRDEAEKIVYFDEGGPVFATSNLPHDRMGDLLYREGKITRAQHARCRELVAESGRRVGEVLVDMGFLKLRELLPAVRRHIEDIIYSLFAWESGEYTMIGGESAAGEKIRLLRHPGAVIVEGIRRKYGLDILEQRVGSANSVVCIRDEQGVEQLLEDLDLGPLERRVIQSLDGERSLVDVSELADVDLLGVCQISFGLIVLGAAEPSVDAADPGVWAEAARVGATDLAIDRDRLLAKHAHVEEADYFMLLGVRREASGFEIQRAYESAQRDYAAESFPSEVRRELAVEIDEINDLLDEAYTVLRDDNLREAYRANLRD